MIEEKTSIHEVTTKPLSEAPRSVREWDGLSVQRDLSPGSRTVKSHTTRRSKSHGGRSRRGSSPTGSRAFTERKSVYEHEHDSGSEHSGTFIERKTVHERESSPATTKRHGTSVSGTEIIEKRIIEEDDIDESRSLHVGPLALVSDRHRSRTDRDIKDEIRRLEAERRDLRRERKYERESIGGTEIIKIERGRRGSSPSFDVLREPSPRGEIIIEKRGEDLVEVRKDKRGRMSLVAR